MPGLDQSLPSLAALLVAHGEKGAMVEQASLSAVLAGAPDPMRVVGYLRGLGLTVARPVDLLAVNDLADEEELAAFLVTEGVAVSIASHDTWVLFRP